MLDRGHNSKDVMFVGGALTASQSGRCARPGDNPEIAQGRDVGDVGFQSSAGCQELGWSRTSRSAYPSAGLVEA